MPGIFTDLFVIHISWIRSLIDCFSHIIYTYLLFVIIMWWSLACSCFAGSVSGWNVLLRIKQCVSVLLVVSLWKCRCVSANLYTCIHKQLLPTTTTYYKWICLKQDNMKWEQYKKHRITHHHSWEIRNCRCLLQNAQLSSKISSISSVCFIFIYLHQFPSLCYHWFLFCIHFSSISKLFSIFWLPRIHAFGVWCSDIFDQFLLKFKFTLTR